MKTRGNCRPDIDQSNQMAAIRINGGGLREDCTANEHRYCFSIETIRKFEC